MKDVRIALGVGVIALLIGAIGPWVNALGVISVGPTSSIETSIIVFGGAALLALSAILNRATRIASVTVGTLAVAEAAYTLVKVYDAKAEADEWGALFGPGWGLYVTVLAGAYLIASTWLARHRWSAAAPA